MTDPLKLADNEIIQDSLAPSDDPWSLPLCRECGQVAYRVVLIANAAGTTRKVPLCGMHLTHACIQYPDLNKYNRGGKIG